ncbi:protease inhibitor I9 family protein [Streptomyces sp. NPDC046161]|uniref:protease inhibitor I9 family protein n=1 Tax=Streptomyces sp. NPDC046161 TaxID=3155132 RepID=UPI0033D9987A
MPSFIVTVHDGKDKEAAKQHAIDCGGKITHEYGVINAFAVQFPEGNAQTLDSHPDVKAVEPA